MGSSGLLPAKYMGRLRSDDGGRIQDVTGEDVTVVLDLLEEVTFPVVVRDQAMCFGLGEVMAPLWAANVAGPAPGRYRSVYIACQPVPRRAQTNEVRKPAPANRQPIQASLRGPDAITARASSTVGRGNHATLESLDALSADLHAVRRLTA